MFNLQQVSGFQSVRLTNSKIQKKDDHAESDWVAPHNTPSQSWWYKRQIYNWKRQIEGQQAKMEVTEAHSILFKLEFSSHEAAASSAVCYKRVKKRREFEPETSQVDSQIDKLLKEGLVQTTGKRDELLD